MSKWNKTNLCGRGRPRHHLARAVALALVMAMAGFSYATSTSSRGVNDSGGVRAASRGVGTSPLRFTNPVFQAGVVGGAPGIFELGDACYGSTIVRYITATGGLRPYRYQQNSLNALLAPGSSMVLNSSGCLMGTVAAATATPLLFSVTVTDSAGSIANSLTGNFALNMMVCPPGVFRFAVDRVNNGVVGLSYVAALATVGGDKTIEFSVLPNTLTVNGIPRGVNPSLEAIGLSLASDGTIIGRPLEAGRITFGARAVDSVKRIASDRTGTVQDQVISFVVEDNLIASSDYVTLSCSAKGDVGQFNKDSIRFTGLVNLNGATFISLNGTPFAFRLGGASYEGRFDRKGHVVNDRGGPLVFADGSRMRVFVNPRTGQLKGTITKTSLGRALDGVNITNRGTRRFGLQAAFCNVVVASDLIEFNTRKNGDNFQIDYKMGRIGRPMGGQFMMTNVAGKDQFTVAGQEGVAWKVKFIAVPRFGIDVNPGFDSVSSISVRIGTNYDLQIDSPFLVTSSNGSLNLIKNNLRGELVSKLSLSSRTFLGQLETQPLSPFRTGIRQAKFSAGGANFTFGLDIDRSTTNSDFNSDGARGISAVPSKGIWVDQANLAR